MEFKEKLKKYQDILNKELDKYLTKEDCPEKILNDSVEYSLISGGKRLRPILVLASYELFREDYEECMPFAVAIEMIHNFSLIHDDMPEIDNDDFRHGKPTNHKKFGQTTALLAGDALFNKAYMVISEELTYSIQNQYKDVAKNKVRAFKEFTGAVDRMIAGEYLDTELEGHQITPEMLEYIHINKTASLLIMCVKMGAIIAGAEESDVEGLTNYADKIGLAFQIKDDILSEEGDAEIMGKPVGNDKEAGKCTYVSQYGLDGAKEELNKITKEAIKELEKYGDKADFLRDLALYIKDRNK